MSGFPIDDPVRLERELRQVDWGMAIVNGELLLRYCPMCQAGIAPKFNNDTSATPRDQHINYHVAVATMLKNIRA